MSRREFLSTFGAVATTGALMGMGGQSKSAQQTSPTIGSFDEPEASMTEHLQRPWELTEGEWSSIINRVRAGARLKPRTWPNNSRFAVAFSFDCDHEAAVLAGGNTSPGRLAWGQRGRRIGIPRILDTLGKHNVPASFFVPAVAALLDSDQVRRIVTEGHEVGLHGWIHANNSHMDRDTEREILLRARDVLQKVTGQEIVGHRSANFDMSPNTIELVAELGLEYDSSMMADDSCYEILLDGNRSSGLVEVPVEWVRDDAVYLSFSRAGSRPWLSPSDVFEIFRAELDAAASEGDLFQLLMHPYVSGYRSRIWVLEKLIEHANSISGAWFGTHKDVANWVRANGE